MRSLNIHIECATFVSEFNNEVMKFRDSPAFAWFQMCEKLSELFFMMLKPLGLLPLISLASSSGWVHIETDESLDDLSQFELRC